MRILQLSPHDHKGGASRIAWYLFEGYKQRGLESYLAVGIKDLDDPRIIEIDHSQYQKIKILGKIRKWSAILIGLENFYFPGTLDIPHLPGQRPDIIHAHNLQGRYFDLRALPSISSQFPTVLTLHDTWLLTGHCAYFMDCYRWRTGCGKCPQLELSPGLRRDASAFNWSRKKKIYTQSRLYVATPSKWLLDQVEQSILMDAIAKVRVIHNGVDNSIYKPAEMAKIRHQLGIPQNAFILLYVVSSRMKNNPYKDYATIEQALNHLQTRLPSNKKVIFLGVGEGGETQIAGNIEKRLIPYQKDIKKLAKYYQSADIYIHAARADTFPNVILEALSCGTPVIATRVGGIGEQIIEGKTGYFVPAQGAEQMSGQILALLDDKDQVKKMSFLAAQDARKRFSVNRMVKEYLDFYHEVLVDFSPSNSGYSWLERQ